MIIIQKHVEVHFNVRDTLPHYPGGNYLIHRAKRQNFKTFPAWDLGVNFSTVDNGRQRNEEGWYENAVKLTDNYTTLTSK